MLIKTGDAEIIGVVDPDKTKDDKKRKEALSKAMDDATEKTANKKETISDEEETTES